MSDWERLKENVEPIKSGRSGNTLKTGLNQRPEELNVNEMKRKEFETQLWSYSGEDLLSVYYDYIQWIEVNHHLSGNEANLKTLLEKCMERFYDSNQYRNDERLLNIFLKFIKRVDNPLEMFHFFHENGFATKLSHFYINWSFHLENAKNCRKATDVLREGLAEKAEPVRTLNRALEQLKTRVAKVVVNNKMDDLNDNEEEEEMRQPLNKPKGKTKKGKRIGKAVNPSSEALKTTSNGKKVEISNKMQTIYCEENEPIVATSRLKLSAGHKHVGAIGLKNGRKEEKLSENQIKQKNINSHLKPKFTIHADESEEESPEPLKIPPQSKSSDNHPIARFERCDPLKKFAFSMDKVYVGGEEFSFEEIRGRQLMARMKKDVEGLRCQKLEEEVAQLRRQVELLLNSQQSSQQTEPKVQQKAISPERDNKAPEPSSPESSAKPSDEIKSDNCSPLPSSFETSAEIKSDPNFSEIASKATMSLMRDLWNGTLATDMVENNTKNDKKLEIEKNDDKPKENENFLIFSDTSIVSKPEKTNKFRVSAGFWPKVRESTGYMDYTIALPKTEHSFFAKTGSSSTPVADKSKKVTLDVDAIKSMQNNVNFVSGMTAKLSPIIETSKEYNSKSSSSPSATMSTTGGSALSRRQRVLSGVQHIDPFDTCLLAQLLESLVEPIDSRKGFLRVKKSLPKIKPTQTVIKLGTDRYLVEKLIATGAYAQVYSAQIEDMSDSDLDSTNKSDFSKFVPQKWFALKVAKQANEWEFYICDELHKRLTRSKGLPDIELSIMSAKPTVMFKDGCILVDEFEPNGTLIDVVNICKKADKPFPKSLTAYYALELIQIVQQMHKNLIIHADLKPDNILVLNFPVREDVNNVMKRTSSLKVIDFGRSIDLQHFPEGTTFNVNVTTKGSQCCQMLDSKPWTFQTDWFGVLDCIHVMVFGDYIKVNKNKDNNKWEVIEKFKRYHQKDIWEPLFETLLNIPNCEQTPDLSGFVNSLNDYIKDNVNQIVRDGNDIEILVDSQLRKRK